MLALTFFTLLSTASAQALIPPGTVLDDAAAIQLSDEGLNALGGALDVLIPSPVAVDDVSQSGGFSCLGYALDLTNLSVDVEVTGARLVPVASNSQTRADIQLELDLVVALNDINNKFGLDYEIVCISGSCPGYVMPFPVTVSGPVSMLIVDDGTGTGETTLDVSIGTLAVDNGLEGRHIELDCGIDTIEDLLNQVGLSFFDIIIGALDPVLQGLIQDQVAGLEDQLSEALAAASIDEVIDLQGIALHMRLFPGSATSTADGMQIGLSGFMEADVVSECVPATPSGSLFTDDEALPGLAALGSSHAALQLSDDVANQGMYGVWKGGLLCFELGEGAETQIDLGLPINASLLGLIGGDEYAALFPDEGPLYIRTNPRSPPEVDYGGAHDITLKVRDLDLDFYAELDHRMARPLGVTIEADAGIDVVFDATTGQAAIDLALGPDEITPIASMIEVAPNSKETVEDNFAGLMETLLDSLLGSALDGLAFGLPTLDGFGITDLALGGSAGTQWLTGDASLGTVSYVSGGCDQGCSGGGSGCSTGSAVPWLFVFVLPVLRRRRDS